MSTSRKRYRPLEIGEEREIGLLDVFSVDTLDDEKSYCFSWPEAPLSLTMGSMYAGGDPKNHTVGSSVSFPKILKTESSDLDISSEFRWLKSNLDKKIVINLHQSTQCVTSIDSSSKVSFPPEESIFSLTEEQLCDARRIGLFSPDVIKNEVEEKLLRSTIEAEIVHLEWRAFKEAKHTASTLQRLLSLEDAVPLLFSTKWKKLVYILWIFWRTHGQKPTSNSNQRWGSSLLPGAFLYGIHNDYFLNSGTCRQEAGSCFMPGRRKTSFISRRRSVYNFLSWKVERLSGVPHRRQRVNYRMQLTPHFSILSTSDVETIVAYLICEPYEKIEFDDSHFSINFLECADLKEEVQTWKKWLDKV